MPHHRNHHPPHLRKSLKRKGEVWWGEGKLSGESFPSLSPNPSPSSSKTFNWWGGRAKGVRSDASPKEQVPAGRLEQRFSPCPLIILQCESSEVGPPKSSDVWGNMFHSQEYAALGNAVNKDSISIKVFGNGGMGSAPMGLGKGKRGGAPPPFFRKVSPPPSVSPAFILPDRTCSSSGIAWGG